MIADAPLPPGVEGEVVIRLVRAPAIGEARCRLAVGGGGSGPGGCEPGAPLLPPPPAAAAGLSVNGVTATLRWGEGAWRGSPRRGLRQMLGVAWARQRRCLQAARRRVGWRRAHPPRKEGAP
eukprot:TRINITY_DN2273_c0_g1_i3.p2 TRINITY_DN2273_c0_g1~~TRINITY_DN2273_c0_g1_i3.p2  ORF type:complete len:122 (+),score=7.35 TRINITY_DN2273_c0_g1_i3:440-805(+)